MADFSRPRLPLFSGVAGEDLRGWIADLDLYFVAAGVGEGKQAATAALLLTGAAKMWWSSLSASARTEYLAGFTAFTKGVEERFKPLDVTMEARSRLASLRLSAFPSFDEFALTFQGVANQIDAGFSVAELLHALYAALPPTVAETVILSNPESLADAVATSRKKLAAAAAVARLTSSTTRGSAAAVDSTSDRPAPTAASVASIPTNLAMDTRMANLERKLDALLASNTPRPMSRPPQRRTNRTDLNGRPVCNTCGSPDHFARSCERRVSSPQNQGRNPTQSPARPSSDF